jgi:hypothetical protein
MDREGALPDRCVACNRPAGGRRLRRKLYSSPLAWRIGALATPFVAMAVGLSLGLFLVAALFWPLVIVLMIAHTFVRKSFKVELGLCARHRGLRYLLLALSTACIFGVFAGIVGFRTGPAMAWLLLASTVALLVLAAVQSRTGAQAVDLKELTPEHAWLSGTGAEFRDALPELQ